jgi:hypothetical protein
MLQYNICRFNTFVMHLWYNGIWLIKIKDILFATARTVRGSNASRGEILRTRPDRPRGPPSLVSNVYRVFSPGGKRPGCGADHTPLSISGVEYN